MLALFKEFRSGKANQSCNGAPHDTPEDGLKDWWTLQYFSSRIGVDKNDDPDHDGMSNLAEFIAGTDPASFGSLLALTAGAKVTNGFEVRWSSAAGRRYTLLKATSLTGTFEPVATDLAATPPENSRTVANADSAAFYKIQVEQ